MRNYRSTLPHNWLDLSHAHDLRQGLKAGETGSDLTPRCVACSGVHGKRIAVTKFAMVHSGKLGTGEYYTDFRAQCHGSEEVLRIKGMKWPPKGDASDLAAIAALPFFAN